MITPYYQFEHLDAQLPEPGIPDGRPPFWRVVVWDDFAHPTTILGVAEHEDEVVLQHWVRDTHPEAKSHLRRADDPGHKWYKHYILRESKFVPSSLQ